MAAKKATEETAEKTTAKKKTAVKKTAEKKTAVKKTTKTTKTVTDKKTVKKETAEAAADEIIAAANQQVMTQEPESPRRSIAFIGSECCKDRRTWRRHVRSSQGAYQKKL